jgi:hypothetical protein
LRHTLRFAFIPLGGGELSHAAHRFVETQPIVKLYWLGGWHGRRTSARKLRVRFHRQIARLVGGGL